MTASLLTVSDSNALVLFGVTGDPAQKRVFPVFYTLVKQRVLNVPIIGVDSPNWSMPELRDRMMDGQTPSGRIDDECAVNRLESLLSFVSRYCEEVLAPLNFRLKGLHRSLSH